jgi:hypothetical protein
MFQSEVQPMCSNYGTQMLCILTQLCHFQPCGKITGNAVCPLFMKSLSRIYMIQVCKNY